MNRRNFVRLGLLAGAAYLGRAQVAVPGLWRPPLTYNVNDMFRPLDEMLKAIQLKHETDLSRVLFGTGRLPNTFQFHPAALQTILDLSSSFDAHPARDDAFLGYDRTKLYG